MTAPVILFDLEELGSVEFVCVPDQTTNYVSTPDSMCIHKKEKKTVRLHSMEPKKPEITFLRIGVAKLFS